MKKILLNLLFAVMMVPWITQSKAQCDNNAPMCDISIEMYDMYDDGWNNASLSIYQGTDLRGTVEMDMDLTVQTVSVPVCSDSIRFVWTSGDYDEECSFNVYDAVGNLLLAMAEGSLENVSGELATIYATCPSCLRPASFVTTGNTLTSIDLAWVDSIASTWQIVYGPLGINPDSVLAQVQEGEVLDNITTNTLTISDLETGVPMTFYLRADCGAGDYSSWLTLTGTAGTYDMAATGFDSITACAMVIYDNGGLTGDYAASSNSTLIVYPTEGNVISMYGSIYSESGYDLLKIYDGAGTSGPLLGEFDGNLNIEPFISDLGPVTLVFTSDGSVNYSGFELFVSCVEAPDCARPYSPAIVSLGNSDVTIAWVDSTATYNYEIEYDTVGFEVGNGTILTTPDTVYQLTELLSNTEYEAHIRILCQNGGYSTDRIIRFRTACDPYPTDSLPFIENFDDWTSIDPCWKTKNSSATSTYPSLSSSQSITSNGKSIYMYNSSSGMYNMISLPIFESDANTLQVNFWLRKPNSSYNHAVQVGVCTDPTDASTFVPVATVAPAAVDTWEQFTVYLNTYVGEGKFIAFRTPSSITYDQLYLDSVTVSPLPTCTAPENIRVAAVGSFSAMIAWEPNAVGEMSSYTLEISETGMDAWTSYNTTDIYTSISGLTLGTTYDVRVRTDCTDESSIYSDVISFTTLSCAGSGSINGTADTVFVGDTASTSTSSYLPTYTFYNYSYTQQIFTNNELNGVGTIAGMDFFVSSGTKQRNITIYMARTNADDLSSGYVTDADFTQVYSGIYTFVPGVNHIDFSTPFAYGESGNLLLLVRDNTGSYESGLSFVTHTASGTKARYIYQDSAPYTSAPSGGTSTTSRNNIQFYYYPCETDPDACSAPLVVATEVGVTNATIAWTAGNSETSFDVEYKLQDDTVWTSVLQATSEETTTITDLIPDNYYNIRVTNDCGGYAVITVYTECGKIDAYPFVESFDGTTIPSCWTGISNYNSSYPNTSTSYRIGSTGRSMYMYCYATTANAANIYTLIAPPAIDTTVMPIDTLQVSFAIYASSDYTNQGAVVGVMTDPTDYSTFVPIDTVRATYGSWVYDEVPLSAYNGNGTYIAIVSKNIGYSTNTIYIDDLEINVIPSCPRPRDLAVDTATLSATSATINWTATGASDYIIEYGLHNFQLGTGNVETSNTNSISLTGLNPSSIYDVYVRGLCEGNDTSEWSFMYSFYTDCVDIESLPYYENFNGWTNTVLKVPYCWIGNSTYSSSYPNMSTSYDYNGVTGGKALYMYNYYSTGYNYYTKVSLPEVSSQISINTTQLVFQLRNTSSSTAYQGGVVVGISVDPNDLTTFTPIDTIMATYNEWTLHEVPFDTYTGAGTYVTIRDYIHVASGTSGYNNTYIDDITLETIPSCRRPRELATSNPTPTTIDLGWTDLSSPNSYVIEYGPIGFELGTGTKVAANTNPFTLTGLTPGTEYEYYVRGVCAGTDSSEYSRTSRRFATLQNPATVPYTYNFEDVAEWNNWQVNCNDSVVNWYRGDATAQGTYSLYISADTGTTNSTIFRRINATAYRDIDFGTIDSSFILTFDAKIGGNTSGVYDALAIVLADPNDYVEADNDHAFGTPWGQINDPNLHVYDYFRLTNDEWQTFSVPFDTISGVHRVAFFWFNQSTQDSWQDDPAAVDNINIDYSACPRPLNLTAVPSTTTASLSWDGTASGYVVYYREVNATTLDSLYTTSNTCVINGLASSGVEYVWAVRAVCGSDTSMYSDSHVFKTTCFDGAVTEFPYIEDFEIGLDCWTQEYVSSTEDWYANNGSYYSTDNAYSGSQNALFNYSGHGPTTILVSPVMNLNSISNPYLMFAHMQRNWGTTDQDTLGVYYRLHEDSAWVYLVSYNTHMPDWQLDSIGLPESSSTFQIGFLAHAEYGYGVAIDSVVVNGEGPLCAQPNLTVSILNNTAEITWPEVGNYELQYREATATTFGDVIELTNASSYMLSSLSPLTEYVCQVRRYCGEEDGYSIWSEITFTTDDLPCVAPMGFSTSNVALTSATIAWTDSLNNQEAWKVAYGYGADASAWDTVQVTSASINLTNLYSNTEYTVYVKAYCSVEADVTSEWSDAFTFRTATCEGVSNITSSAVTANSATINWTPGANQTKWEISYGMEGVSEANGTKVVVENTPAYTIEGLESDFTYDVYVRTVCEEGVYSAWSNKIQFRTTVGINTASADNVRVQIYPNPANSEATISVDGVNGKVEFVLADMNGRMIVTESINCEGSLVKTIDVSNLAKGAYFVHIYNDDFNTTRKLVVK